MEPMSVCEIKSFIARTVIPATMVSSSAAYREQIRNHQQLLQFFDQLHFLLLLLLWRDIHMFNVRTQEKKSISIIQKYILIIYIHIWTSLSAYNVNNHRRIMQRSIRSSNKCFQIQIFNFLYRLYIHTYIRILYVYKLSLFCLMFFAKSKSI